MPASAATIDVTSLMLGPTNTIQIGGVTITGENAAQVASKAGLGLEAAGGTVTIAKIVTNSSVVIS